MQSSTDLPSSLPFNLLGSMPLFNYLTYASNRTQFYRSIMRTLLHFHREYRHYVTDQEVREAVLDLLDLDYPLDKCREDLDYLKQCGNVTTIYDPDRANSIAEFVHKPLLYQASPEALALEIFLEEQIGLGRRTGTLDRSNLDLIFSLLKQVDVALDQEFVEAREVAEDWQNAFTLWDTLSQNVSSYMRMISDAAHQSSRDLESFISYKKAVVQYVHSFAETLLIFGRDIRDLLNRWVENGKRDRLIALVVQHQASVDLLIETPEGAEERLKSMRHQVRTLTLWFAEGGNTEIFQRTATMEISQLVRRATALAVSGSSAFSYASHLQLLAQRFMKLENGEQAQQLFVSAFANAPSLHFPESLFGQVAISDSRSFKSAWDEQPAAQVRLWSLGQRIRGERLSEEPLRDQRKAIEELKAKNRKQDEDRRRNLKSLFHGPLLDIGNLKKIDKESRTLLEEILDGCLTDKDRQYRSQDGSLVTLLNPLEPERVALYSKDGVLRLPRYRLRYDVVIGTDMGKNGSNGHGRSEH